jgi:hypothetical protein
LLEAAGYVEEFSGKIGGTIKNLGQSLWPDFPTARHEKVASRKTADL